MPDTQDRAGSSVDNEELTAAISAAKSAPEEASTWDRVESLAARLEQPEQAVRLYGEVLHDDLPADLVVELGERAAKFHDEWLGADSPHLATLLQRVFEVPAGAEWAFARLTRTLTAAEQWDDLLSLYDRALERTKSKSRRGTLLSEAADVAKDFAGDSDRAIAYLKELRTLKPRNKSVATTLERLLDRHERWEDLVALWNDRLESLSGKKAVALREQIAVCLHDKIGDAERSVAAVETLFAEGGDDEQACRILEETIRAEGTPDDMRWRALALLEKRYVEQNRERDVVSAIEASIGFADEARARDLRERAGGLLASLGESTGSFEHFAAVLEQDPADAGAHEELRHLAVRSGARDRYAELLGAVGRATDKADVGARMLVEAARLYRDSLDDRDRAIDTYRAAANVADAPASVVIEACREVDALLAEAGRDEERLDVLERHATAEEHAGRRRELLGRQAIVAEDAGDLLRAASVWTRRIDADPSDLDAIDALVRVQSARESWAALADALRLRADAPGPDYRKRADLRRLAAISRERLEDNDRSIAALRDVVSAGEAPDSAIDNLADLLAGAQRWDEYVALMDGQVGQQSGRAADVAARLGDALRAQGQELHRAVAAYRSALAVDPRHERSRTALTELLDDADARVEALDALARAFDETNEWKGALDLVDARLEEATSDEQRIKILGSAARIAEREANDPQSALAFQARALELAPNNVDLADDIERLAESCQGFAQARDAFGAAAEKAGADGDVEFALRMREGAICEERLVDAPGAVAAFRKAADLHTDDAALRLTLARLAPSVSDWDLAATSLVAATSLRGRIDEVAVRGFNSAAAEDRAPAAAALAAAVQSADGLAPAAASRFEHVVATWLRDDLQQRGEARAALRRALEHTPGDRNLLLELVDIERDDGGRPLYETLRVLAETDVDDLDALVEAAPIAVEVLDDREAAVETHELLLRRALRLWRQQQPARGKQSPESCARLCLERLLDLYLAADEIARARDLAADATGWPISDDDERNRLRVRAADLSSKLGDAQRATSMLRAVLAIEPDNSDALERLAVIYREQDDVAGTLWLRRVQLERETDAERALELRLEIAELVGELELRGRRVETLLENLAQAPGHRKTLESLTVVLAERGRHAELADIFTRQAKAVAEAGDRPRSAELWFSAGEVADKQLADVDRALDAYSKCGDDPGTAVAALDGRARLHDGRGEHFDAASCLEKMLAYALDNPGDVRMRLATSLRSAGHTERAINALEAAGDERAARADMRASLTDMYREREAWEPLARLLTQSLDHLEDPEESLEVGREAASLYRDRLEAPERAVSALRRMVELKPDDIGLRQSLAEGLRLAGQLDEARETLESILRTFGRRRTPARAAAHYELALVARAEDNIDEALAQLDEAASIDVDNVGLLEAAARLVKEAGDFDRAERLYRSLLLAVRRREASDDIDEVGESQVLFELHYLAAENDDSERAEELRESAVEAAGESDAETFRACKTLRAHGDPDALREVLEQRLEAVEEGAVRGELLARLSEVCVMAGDHDEALEHALDAVRSAPEVSKHHELARTSARASDDMEGYLAVVRDLVAKRRRKQDAALLGSLRMHLGSALEQDVEDLDGAAEAYRRAAEEPTAAAQAYSALARVCGELGDAEGQTEALAHLLELADGASPAWRADALYQVAELRAGQQGAHDEALDRLEAALDTDPNFERAVAIVKRVLDQEATSERALRVYERCARRANDWQALLDFIERRAGLDDAAVDDMREGVELANANDAPERARKLLERALERARDALGGLAEHAWVASSLVSLRKTGGDLEGAAELVRELLENGAVAAIVNDAVALAATARDAGKGDLAVDLLQDLRSYEPTRRAVWEPLFDMFAEAGDYDQLEDLASSTASALVEVRERNEVRNRYAAILEQDPDRRRAALEVYKDVLLDEPGNVTATRRWEALLEETGTPEEVAAFLNQRFDEARRNGDIEAVSAIALRLRERLGDSDPAEVKRVLEAALEVAPEDTALLQALVEHIGEDGDPAELATLKRRLLDTADDSAAVGLCLEIGALWQRAGDYDAALDVLRRAYGLAPERDEVRERLEGHLREGGDVRALANYLGGEAERVEDPSRSVELLREVATIRRDMLFDGEGANSALKLAAELAPQDTGVLFELVQTLEGQGDSDGAVAELRRALEAGIDDDERRVDVMLALASSLSNRGEAAAATEVLEQAVVVSPERAAGPLEQALSAQALAARDADDLDAERAAILRLSGIYRESDRVDQCRKLLEHWLARAPGDRDALVTLADLAAGDERWDDVIAARAQLVQIDADRPERQLESARSLAEVAARGTDPEGARHALEVALFAHPGDQAISGALRSIYEAVGAHRELAQLLVQEAAAIDDVAERLPLLLRGVDLLLQSDDPNDALPVLEQARQLAPDDPGVQLRWVDTLTNAGDLERAREAMDELVKSVGRAVTGDMLVRQAHLAQAAGDLDAGLKFLQRAFDKDRDNGHLAYELAGAAVERENYALAIKALRAISLKGLEGPLSVHDALIHEGRIELRRGNNSAAQMLAKKALRQEPDSAAANELLAASQN